MGFETNNDKSNSQDQLSLFDFKMPKADFVTAKEEGSSAVDFNMWLMAHKEPETNKTSRFMTVSATVHAAAILLIAMMTVPLVEQVKTETITIEIEDVAPPMKIARGVAVPATQGGAPTQIETPVTDKMEEVGDVLFVLVNYARMLGINSEEALRQCNAKFERRFRGLESDLKSEGVDLKDATLARMEEAWTAQKKKEKSGKT